MKKNSFKLFCFFFFKLLIFLNKYIIRKQDAQFVTYCSILAIKNNRIEKILSIKINFSKKQYFKTKMSILKSQNTIINRYIHIKKHEQNIVKS